MRDNGYAASTSRLTPAVEKGVEPTLTRTAGQVGSNVAQCHEWVDRIEIALFGGPQVKTGESLPPVPPGLQSQIDTVADWSAALFVRLQRVAELVGG